MAMEQRMDQLEKRNKRLTIALTMTVVAMAAVVTMAATGDKDGRFDTVVARKIYVENDAGKIVVALRADDGGDGLVFTASAKGKEQVRLNSTVNGGVVTTYHPNGKELVVLSSTVNSHGVVATYHPNGKELVELNSTVNGGMVITYQPNGKELVVLSSSENGGGALFFNKTGEGIVLMGPDEYGNGVVGAYNRKGDGRTLQPGP